VHRGVVALRRDRARRRRYWIAVKIENRQQGVRFSGFAIRKTDEDPSSQFPSTLISHLKIEGQSRLRHEALLRDQLKRVTALRRAGRNHERIADRLARYLMT
jgi:hypothetical protein